MAKHVAEDYGRNLPCRGQRSVTPRFTAPECIPGNIGLANDGYPDTLVAQAFEQDQPCVGEVVCVIHHHMAQVLPPRGKTVRESLRCPDKNFSRVESPRSRTGHNTPVFVPEICGCNPIETPHPLCCSPDVVAVSPGFSGAGHPLAQFLPESSGAAHLWAKRCGPVWSGTIFFMPLKQRLNV
jgi:hypothetical protein